MGKKYVSNKLELIQYLSTIKFVSCPHCGQVGYLICHGKLRGYSENNSDLVIRGQRIFCSNRYNKLGCGRTFSVLLADFIRGFVVNVFTLWKFVLKLSNGFSVKAAWKSAGSSFSLASGYRLLKRLQLGEHHLRTLLCKKMKKPPDSDSSSHLFQTLIHIQKAFPEDECGFFAFQLYFQRSLLE